MKKIKTFEEKKVLILGLAKSGEAAARLLHTLGAHVTVNDGKAFEENPAAQALLEEGIEVICGSHPLELLDEDFDFMVKNPGIRYDNPMIKKALATCEKLMAEPYSPVLGLHLEGPYFNPGKAGAQIPEYITPPIPDDYKDIIDNTTALKRWDEAPELPGTTEFGRYCTEHGVLAAIAHTKAEYVDVKRAWDCGFRHATHFYNAMTGFHNVREFKHEGTVESVYTFPEMSVEMIADGIHVPPTILKMIYMVKGVEHTALITDALACSASDSDTAFDPRVILEDGVCKLADRSALAGSIATMDRLVRTCVEKASIPFEDAVRMSSETPARIMGVLDRKGTIEKGKDADICIYDSAIQLQAVIQQGRLVEGVK